jgi:probable F420-dependent oxidoreductase
VKIRIGYGLGTRTTTNRQQSFGELVDQLERLGYDSLWLSERVGGDAPDPVVGMAYAAGRTTRLKFGMSVMVLPGRNPVLVAQALASLDRLSEGRLLPAFGLGVRDPHEQSAFMVDRAGRAAMFDEALALMRRLWSEDAVDHAGEHYQVSGVTVRPRPVQDPLDVWLGGAGPRELRRVGETADGWLPSFTTPAIAAEGWAAIDEAADAVGRALDPEHFGALIPYSVGPVPDAMAEIVRRRRPDADVGEVVPSGVDGLRRQIERFCEVGASKFVPIPVNEPSDWAEHLAEVADAVLPLQN